MDLHAASTPPASAWRRAWPAVLAWAAGWALLTALDGWVDLANLAMVLVLSATVASLWLPVWASALAAVASVLAFNWSFVPPRGTFAVGLQQHVVLLAAMVVVNAILGTLTAALRRQLRLSDEQARRVEQLRRWSDTLRDAADPLAHAGQLHEALVEATGVPVALLVLKDAVPATDDEAAAWHVGVPDDDQRAGLWVCLRRGQAMGPGTGRHQELADVYLPLRGPGLTLGAVVLRGLGEQPTRDDLREHAQSLCDAMGQALQRGLVARGEQRAREQAQTQAVRNALLAAISHDYRTPLATIMGAASSLDEQGERLSVEQRRRLARSIVDEAAQLGRLTDNTLQLARLDAPGVTLRCDWESAEEIVGAALTRARRRDPERRVRARLEPDVPLLWCDALLMAQLLDNLIDNALKYSAAGSPVEILVRRLDAQILLAVRDRGAGVAPAWRDRVFEVFHRGAAAVDPALAVPAGERPGAGVGLAVCRAIARAHGGELTLRARSHGGSSFECRLPVREPPPGAAGSVDAP